MHLLSSLLIVAVMVPMRAMIVMQVLEITVAMQEKHAKGIEKQ